MKPFTSAFLALSLLASPLAAQTMTVLLPSLTFPDGTLTTSTKGCTAVEAVQSVCVIKE
ncbi:hypothetical protein [Tabrizicola sp.]|uniref:hypothetical protein n=1 Tax=Tabrizicola sp. TaxID=2005166 RepID=UPI00286CDB32|nr:hypothetical protein [Tabrizicola sp.]